jgi:osomolarity two-component system, response regulator SSK1
VIGTARKGDTVEVGLSIESGDYTTVSQNTIDGVASPRVASPTTEYDGLLRCNFRISHRLAAAEPRRASPEEGDAIQFTSYPRPLPSLDTHILRQLLKQIGGTFSFENLPTSPSVSRICELTVTLESGEQSAVNPSVSVAPEDAAILGYPDVHISHEPTLEQLINFAETLRGKSVTLYARSSGSFAHHLSSYLTAWGMDVSHMSTEPGANGEYELVGESAGSADAPLPSIDIPSSGELPQSLPHPAAPGRKIGSDPVFTLIDDDVTVLRSRLQQIKAEQAYPLNLHGRNKRPSLATNHRPRSSPQVARVMGMMGNAPPQPQVVIVHFTSLANFKLVKDVIQMILTPTREAPGTRIPEVIVIPKPAGPRRFLTALHTAVTRPVVDPYFVPTATSPMSPGLHSISPFFNIAGPPRSPSGRSTASVRTSSDKSARSPKDVGEGFTTGHAPPSPLSQSDNIEYFSDAAVKLGSSPATGLLIQSPDGQPTGIIFNPKPRSSSNVPPSPNMERAHESREIHHRHRSYSRVSSGEKHDGRGNANLSGSPFSALRPSPRPTPASSEGSDTFSAASKGKSRQSTTTISEDSANSSADQAPVPPPQESMSPQSGRGFLARRPSQQPNSPPTSPQTRAAPGPPHRRGSRRVTPDVATPPANAKKGVKGPADGNIVPPISVLIVDGTYRTLVSVC